MPRRTFAPLSRRYAMADFSWNNPYPSIRVPLFARNIVSTSHPLAVQAGLRMLLKGGNAADAAIAAAAALVVVEPVSCGIGGDAFALVWDGDQLHGLNASGPAPAVWTPEYFEKKHEGKIPLRGWGSVTVPGAVAAWVELSERYGKLPFADLFEPAIELAERGFMVSPVAQHKWAAAIPHLKTQPGFKRVFMPRGRAPEVGERFVFPEVAHGLTRIAETHGEVFYRGEMAEAMAHHAKQHGGALTLDDLGIYKPEWVTPIAKDYAGYTVHQMPPNGQGIAALMALGIVDKLNLTRHEPDSADSLHLQIEAMKLALADTWHWVADSRHMTKMKAADLLDDAYLAERARLISKKHTVDFRNGTPPKGGTAYLAAADDNGMMVSFIQSNCLDFGSGIVVPETGISLHNQGACFTLSTKHPNCVAPGKHPLHTLSPGFVTREGKPQMSFGITGGSMQPQGHLQTLVRMLGYGHQPQAACDAPRWKIGHTGAVGLEEWMLPEIAVELAERGHQIETEAGSYLDFGAGQFVWKTEHGYIAASDPRRDGQAAGF